MTITIVCDILNDAHNGTNITTMNLVNYLRSKGHKVKILCCDKTKQGDTDYFICPTKNYGSGINYLIRKAGILSSNPKKGKDIIASAINGSDIVHLMLPFGLCKAAWKEAKRQNVPVTSGVHLLPENFWAYIHLDWCKPLVVYLYKHWFSNVYKHANYLQYISPLIRERYEKYCGQTNGVVISNGIPPNITKQVVSKPDEFKDKIVILSVGRYGSDKNQATLLKAIRYSKYKDKIQLILAGSGWLIGKYKKLGNKLPIKPILKPFNRTNLAQVINYADICVHPAFVEAEGISVLEQVSCGKLVIVSDSKYSATKSFAVNENCIFKAKNAKDLAAKIDYWIEHPQEKIETENQYLESAKKYQLDYCMNQMEQMLINVINQYKK